MKNIAGSNCLLTGAAHGIGRAMAALLAQEGVNLFLVDLDEQSLERVGAQLRETGAEVRTAGGDVSRIEDWRALRDRVCSDFGRLDMLINNAAIGGGGRAHTLEDADWQRILNVNLWSVIHSIKVFLPDMLEQRSGHFINVASGAGIIGLPLHLQYIASKFAVVGITEALYSEYSHTGVSFSVICPARIRTNIVDRSFIAYGDMFQNADPETRERKLAEFKQRFWSKDRDGAISAELAAARYVAGIKKEKLYILDTPKLRIAMVLKGAFEGLYKRVLRSEGKRSLAKLKQTLNELGIDYPDL